MAKKVDPAKAKAKRDKIVAGVLGGVLLLASVFAVPMTLKQWKKLNGGDQVAQPVTPTQTTPAPGAGPLATTAGGGAGIAGTISAPLATGELRSFDLFESKDPFKPQVDVKAGPGVPGPIRTLQPPSVGSHGSVGSPTAVPVTPVAPPRAPPEPPPTAAVISVNGAPAELLGVGVEFPLPPAEAIFRLESVARGRARVSIVGGSYASGDAAVTVKVGKPLTLENTADGTRYELRLLWVGSGAPPAGLVPAPPNATAPTATPSTPTATP